MKYETEFLGRPLKIETNSYASQASGSVLVSFGNTAVLGTATMSDNEIDADFFPLSVDYEERFYASGKIRGSRFVRREGRPSEEAVLVGRMIDRAIRPYFPKDFRREIQVVLTVFSFDEENDPDFPALIAASAALSISNIPWDGPIAALRIAKNIGSDEILAPVYAQRQTADLDLFVSGIEDLNGEILFNMIDGEAQEVSEEEVLSSFESTKESIKKLIQFQNDIKKKEGKEKIPLEKNIDEIKNIYKKYYSTIKDNLLCYSEDLEKKKKGKLSQKELLEKLEVDPLLFDHVAEEVLHNMALEEGLRCDGRKLDEVRKLNSEVAKIPKAHGSGLFARGLTHVLSILTLGAPGDELLLEGMEIVGKKRFLHHYNFPAYSVGEVRRMGSPGRREIGHGALAEKALRPVIPTSDEFPYTIRIVSEVLSSNGSTSMAATCASSLALFDGGVKVKRAVAGISCGLVMEDSLTGILDTHKSKPISERNYKLLTDIQGPEDSLGDMDFKVAGTEKGITAIQLDIKVRGLTMAILKEGLERAKVAREQILKNMESAISSPRSELSPSAPCILSIKINPEKIREVIGPGGKVINSIIDETETSIDIEEDGSVFVTADCSEKAQKAVDWIKNIAREFVAGEHFDGKIRRIMNFGLFIELVPNQDGLLHVSGIPMKMKKKPLEQSFKIGQIVPVKIKGIDQDGKVDLSFDTSSKEFSDLMKSFE
jgi:polyribonucleotide nucleotidyltransferase